MAIKLNTGRVSKAVCCSLAPTGWAYTGYDEGFYLFQQKTSRGWLEMRCLECDLELKNLKLMGDMGLTR